MNADGTGEVDVTNTPTLHESDPAWSPDGQWIAYSALPVGGGNIDVYVMSYYGTGQTRLTTDPALDLSPSWQPDPSCTIRGTRGPDQLWGTAGDDVICAGGGDDVVNAGEGSDLVYGGRGNDTLAGEGGNDILLGAAGNDVLDGGAGFNSLIGGGGADTCIVGTDGTFVQQCEVLSTSSSG